MLFWGKGCLSSTVANLCRQISLLILAQKKHYGLYAASYISKGLRAV